MKIISSFEELKKIQDNIAVALGVFDGLHYGHRQVIDAMLKESKNTNSRSMVITFAIHPKEFINPAKAPTALLTKEETVEKLQDLGVDYIFFMPSDKKFFNIDANEFMKKLFESNIKHVFIGENFTFGKDAYGTPNLLAKVASAKEVNVNTLPLAYVDDECLIPISSTLIRKAIVNGNIALANHLLGYEYSFLGKVLMGDQRGRTLGYPTANFILENGLTCPKDGVYVNRVKVKNKWYYGIGNVGDNPTFKNQYHRIEVHIFDFDEDIYGEMVKVEFLDFIRSEVKFKSMEALVEQMTKDEAYAQEYIKKYNKKDVLI